MTSFIAKLEELVRKDGRYAYEAYEFLFQALNYTQTILGREPPRGVEANQVDARHHVTGPELLEGIRQFALREFGLMARTVLHLWGIEKTDDFGEIVFNLVEGELMNKTTEDTRADFHSVYNLDQALVQGFQIQLDEAK